VSRPSVAIVSGAMLCPGLLGWPELREGRSAVRALDDGFPVPVGAPVPIATMVPEDWPFPVMPRGLALASEALSRLELDPERRYGLILGLPSLLSETEYVEHTLHHREDVAAMTEMLGYDGDLPLTWLSRRLPTAGPRLRVDSACATGNDALITAADWLRAGLVDDCLVVCASAMLNPVGTALFRNLRALSEEDSTAASCPFDLRRRGFVMGEGAAAVWLSRNPPARVLGYLLGQGQSMNAASFTDLPEDQSAMLAACRQALGERESVAYISAHGTGTQVNDAAEARLYRTVFGDRIDAIPVSSIKSMIGHTLGAAALIEALVCLQALGERVAPPTINLHRPDPACALHHVANRPRPIGDGLALSTAFAFGGHNSVVLLGLAP